MPAASKNKSGGSTTLMAGGNIKKQIRDTTRLLSRPNLPADVRVAQERKLKALQVVLSERENSEHERKIASQYRMVRFFERRKAERKVRRAQTAMEKAADEAVYQKALIALREARMDLNYIANFPKGQKYISLYPGTPLADKEVAEERRRLRESISQEIMAKAHVASIEEAPVYFDLEDGESDDNVEAVKIRQALAPNKYANDDDDDGGDDQVPSEEDDGSEGEDDNDDNDDDEAEEENDKKNNSGEDSESDEEYDDDDDDEDEEEEDEDEEEEDEDDDDEDDDEDYDEDEDADEEEEEEDDPKAGASNRKKARRN